MKIGIVGAGWAGLSAAVWLKQSDHQVCVFEASDTPGGRARCVDDPKLGKIDNGQHLMLGAYTETLALIQMLHPGLPQDRLLRRSALRLESLDGQFFMQASSLPSPFNLLTAMLFAKGLGFTDKWRAIAMLSKLKQDAWICHQAMSVEELLAHHRQTPATRRWVWHPLCIAALNTPVADASAQVFLNVLKDSFDAGPGHSDLIVPRVDLSALWPEAATHGLDMRWRHVVRRVVLKDDAVEIDGEHFDYVIVATPPYAASRMLRPGNTPNSVSSASSAHTATSATAATAATAAYPATSSRTVNSIQPPKTIHPAWTEMEPPQTMADSNALLAMCDCLERFTYIPITNITIGLAEPWGARGQMWMLDEQVSNGQYGQWLFVAESGQELRVVISAPDENILNMDHATLARKVHQQIKTQLSQRGHSPKDNKGSQDQQAARPLPELTHFRVLTEKRATYACTTTLDRPGNQTAWPRLMLAGDWTQSPYPAVLESAVRSGKRAAEMVLSDIRRASEAH